jgi:hypothetical protein
MNLVIADRNGGPLWKKDFPPAQHIKYLMDVFPACMHPNKDTLTERQLSKLTQNKHSS